MVDYSKWDKYAALLSDDEEDDAPARPQVTTFDSSKRFEIGPRGIAMSNSGNEVIKPKPLKPVASSFISEEVNYSKNGGVTETGAFYWCQDRYEVVIRKELSGHTKGSQLKVSFDHESNSLRVFNSLSSSYILDGALRYKIELNSGEGEEPVDWDLKTIPATAVITDVATADVATADAAADGSAGNKSTKLLEITFRKVSPFPGTTLWWKNVFVGDGEIDVTTIEGRSQATKDLASAWDEAHKMFKERVATREQISIDVEDDEEDANEDNVDDTNADTGADASPEQQR